MLVAYTCLNEHLTELVPVVHEEGFRLLVDLCISSRHGHSLRSIVGIGIRTMVVGIFTSYREVTLPQGIAQDKLRGPEVVAALGVAVDATRHCRTINVLGLFDGLAWSLCTIKESVEVEVDAQLPQFTIIIGIEDMLLELLVLSYLAFRTLCEETVLVLIGIKLAGEGAIGVIVVFVESAKRVVLVYHIVDLQLWREPLPRLFRVLLGVAVYPESADFCSVNVAEKSGRTPCGYGREVGKGITAAVIFALEGFGLDGTDGLQVHLVHVNVGDLSVRLVQETGGFRTVAKLRKADKVAGGLYQERLGIGTLSLEGGKAVFYRDAGHVYRKPGYDAGLEFLAGGNGDFPGQASALDGNGDLEGGAGNIRGTAGKKDVFGPVRIDGDDIAFAFGRGGGRGRMIHPAAGNAQALVEGKRDGADGLSSRVKVAEGKRQGD